MNINHVRGRISATWLIIVAAVALALGLWAGSQWLSRSPVPDLKTAVMYPAALAVPDFQLQRADGKSFAATDLRGQWTIIFFGFTHCPDVCPTTLAAFKQVWAKLAERGKTDKARFLFISVDPERDTPEQLARYVAFFNKDFVAATGTNAELTRLTRALGILYLRVPDQSGGYSIDHSASAMIIDPEGRRAGMFRPPFEPDAVSADILALIDSSR
ncbi:MAG: SCO family protein [Xanthomonadales bacterium]|nr:SCO family protein [Xanthomonadales bacterium]